MLEKPTLENPTQSKKEIKNTQKQNTDLRNSQSIHRSGKKEADGETDRLEEILDRVDWTIFQANIRQMFRAAIERLYYCEQFKVGNAVLPRQKLREYLRLSAADA